MRNCLILRLTLTTLLLTLTTIVFSQCSTPEKIVKGGGRDKFVVNKQSKSGALKAGESYELTLNTQDGYDYRITSGMDGRNSVPVAFEVFENVTEKAEGGGFKKVKKSIKSSDGNESIEFQIDKANVLTIKVSLPPSESKKPECVAILIEDRKSTKIGF
jgi:hypothetical protein